MLGGIVERERRAEPAVSPLTSAAAALQPFPAAQRVPDALTEHT